MSDLIKIDTIKDWLTYDSPLKFEIIYSNSGVARIYISDRKTSFTAGGVWYCKESTLIAMFINDLISYQNYNSKIYGNSGKYNPKTNKRYLYKRYLNGGVGFSSIESSFNSLKGCKLEKIYSGFNSDTYSLKVNKKIKASLNAQLKEYRLNRGY